MSIICTEVAFIPSLLRDTPMTPECRRPGIRILRYDRTQMAYDSIIDVRLTASQPLPLPFNASRTSNHIVYTHSHRLCLDQRQVSTRFMFPQDLVSGSVIDGFIVSSI